MFPNFLHLDTIARDELSPVSQGRVRHGSAKLGSVRVGVLEDDAGRVRLSRRLRTTEDGLAVGHEGKLQPWAGWAVGEVELQTGGRVRVVGKVLGLTEVICVKHRKGQSGCNSPPQGAGLMGCTVPRRRLLVEGTEIAWIGYILAFLVRCEI